MGGGKGGVRTVFFGPWKRREKKKFFLVTVVSFPFLRYKNNPVSWCVWGRGASRHRKSDKANRARASVFAGIFFFSLLSSSSSYQSHYKFGTIPNLTHRFFFIIIFERNDKIIYFYISSLIWSHNISYGIFVAVKKRKLTGPIFFLCTYCMYGMR